MDKDEFTSLPAPVALGILYDIARAKLESIPAPELPRPPKFDGRLRKQGGFVWYSELSLSDLEYWQKKNAEGATADNKYAEANRKTAETLSRWVAWRRLFPLEQWRGTRGEDKVTAAPPSREPRVHQWDNSKSGRGSGGSSNGGGRHSEPPPPDDDDDLNF